MESVAFSKPLVGTATMLIVVEWWMESVCGFEVASGCSMVDGKCYGLEAASGYGYCANCRK